MYSSLFADNMFIFVKNLRINSITMSTKYPVKKYLLKNFPDGPVVKNPLPVQGTVG